MRIAVLAPDTPYPPNRGGRADIWRRIEGMRELGHRVCLIHHYEPSSVGPAFDSAMAHVDSVVMERVSMPMRRWRSRTVSQLLRMRQTPWHAASRRPSADDMKDLVSHLSAFQPDLYWLDGPWSAEVLRAIPEHLKRPYLYRSHNVEHQYLRSQARSARSLRDRWAWMLASVGVRQYELELMHGAKGVFDISVDDLEYWRSLGVVNSRWLPPLADTTTVKFQPGDEACDVLFTGNLRTPNNLQGLRWLIEQVWPLVLNADPRARLHVLGSAPAPEVRSWLGALPSIDARFDLPDLRQFQFRARVLVNPVFTGSGVQLKMLDMLQSNAPIVTRSQGMRGLPLDMRRAVTVADVPEVFAQAILRGRAAGSDLSDSRRAIQAAFGVQALERALDSVGVHAA